MGKHGPSKIDNETIPIDFFCPPINIPVKSLNCNYRSVQELGTGSFGSVILAERRNALDDQNWNFDPRGTLLDPLCGYQNTSPYVAIKTMKVKLSSIKYYNRLKEMNFIFSIPAHPQLVQIYDTFVDEESYHLRIVMEPMQQNLYTLMKSRGYQLFSSITLKSIISQLLAGIRHIHRNNFFHRDIKPENIFISHTSYFFGGSYQVPSERSHDRFIVKLGDYGLARNIENQNSYTSYVSTRWYRSPEILLRMGYYSLPIDIWAFGCVICEIANFRPLFPGEDELDQISRILKTLGSPTPKNRVSVSPNNINAIGGSWELSKFLFAKQGISFKYSCGIPVNHIVSDPNLQDILGKCLLWDPNKRATAEELSQSKYFENSSFLQNNLHLVSTKENLESEDLIDSNKKMIQAAKTLLGIPKNNVNHETAAVSTVPKFNNPFTVLNSLVDEDIRSLLSASADEQTNDYTREMVDDSELSLGDSAIPRDSYWNISLENEDVNPWSIQELGLEVE